MEEQTKGAPSRLHERRLCELRKDCGHRRSRCGYRRL